MRADDASTRLAVYGTLAPGRKNHWVLEGLKGTWSEGTVRGYLHAEGWGASEGYPALVCEENGHEVPVQVFESEELPANWRGIDEFEGDGYRRTVTPVLLSSGQVVHCHIYELNRDR
jgi:gamma-glutamylcyclotransferase (GGCT)/AIG2-like uncharacterized protein YtfP